MGWRFSYAFASFHKQCNNVRNRFMCWDNFKMTKKTHSVVSSKGIYFKMYEMKCMYVFSDRASCHQPLRPGCVSSSYPWCRTVPVLDEQLFTSTLSTSTRLLCMEKQEAKLRKYWKLSFFLSSLFFAPHPHPVPILFAPLNRGNSCLTQKWHRFHFVSD